MAERIHALASLIPECECFADIGCDHGKLSELVLEQGTASRAIASDISEKSLEKARQRLSGRGNVDFRLGDGLCVLAPGEADVICIAGMGGREMIRILSENAHAAQQARALVLGAQRNQEQLRSFLRSSGYRISTERVVRDRGHYYPLMLVERGHDEREGDPFWDYVAQGSTADPVYREYLMDLHRRTQIRIRGLVTSDADSERLGFLRHVCAAIEEIFT